MKFTSQIQERFCAALADACNVGRACTAAGISRQTAYRWRAEHSEFSQAWDIALRVGVSALEDEAHRRAFDGSDKPIVYQGAITGHFKEYSDTLAIFLLKAHNPEKYRDNSKVELAGHLEIGRMSDDELDAELAELAARLSQVHPAAPCDLA